MAKYLEAINKHLEAILDKIVSNENIFLILNSIVQ